MMTNGPAATIGGILAIDLPRPRDRIALAGNKQYVASRAELLEFLYLKQMRKAA
jgi:nitrate/nitrite transport system ATP-binding protein